MFGIFWNSVLAILIGGLIYVYWYFSKTQNYWRDKGFNFIGTKEVGGGLLDILGNIHVTVMDSKLYKIMEERNYDYAGFMELTTPTIFIKDLELIRSVFVKDFDHFVNRRSDFTSDADLWTQKMLFFMNSEPWKELRSKMSPTFTTGKIRRMFGIIEACSERLVEFLHREVKKSPTINFGEGYGKYTSDVISSAVFGIESGAFREKKSIFERMGEKLQFNSGLMDILKFLVISFTPKVATLFQLKLFDTEACQFFQQIISKSIQHRTTSGEKREDFLQVMLEARAGQLKSDDGPLDVFEKDAAIKSVSKLNVDLSDDVICAQSILFFLAGFDTTQTLLNFAAYQLAVCQEIQEKLYLEVRESLKKNEGKFTYESINEMEYMDKFVSETLRMFPPVPRLDRKCTVPYTIPGTNLVIPADTIVCIPTYSIHHDPKVFPEPSKFNPERFSKEAKAERSPYAFMPFGHGPRNCIGMRFALTESKLAIAQLVRNFVFEPSDKTPIPMKFSSSSSFNLRLDGGTWINLKPRM